MNVTEKFALSHEVPFLQYTFVTFPRVKMQIYRFVKFSFVNAIPLTFPAVRPTLNPIFFQP